MNNNKANKVTEVMVGPYQRNRIVLCSLDASPHSQRGAASPAGTFFPSAKWVGTMRNAAQRLGCDFVILTSAHGMVSPDDVIEPYDLVLKEDNRKYIEQRWMETIPRLAVNRRYEIMVTYFGGCPRDPILDLLMPILRNNNIALLSFGKPNMFDIGKIDRIVRHLEDGCILNQIRGVLNYPDRLVYIT
jgi:hypothetical protein